MSQRLTPISWKSYRRLIITGDNYLVREGEKKEIRKTKIDGEEIQRETRK